MSTCFWKNTIQTTVFLPFSKTCTKFRPSIVYICLLHTSIFCAMLKIQIYGDSSWRGEIPHRRWKSATLNISKKYWGWSGEIPEPTVIVRMREENWCCSGVFFARKICVPAMVLFCCTQCPLDKSVRGVFLLQSKRIRQHQSLFKKNPIIFNINAKVACFVQSTLAATVIRKAPPYSYR